jgi:outer membrane protein OmpA-like peptidoglycan-associated protein
VRDFLIRQGIAPERLEAVGHGEPALTKAPKKKGALREKDRGVELTLVNVKEPNT